MNKLPIAITIMAGIFSLAWTVLFVLITGAYLTLIILIPGGVAGAWLTYRVTRWVICERIHISYWERTDTSWAGSNLYSCPICHRKNFESLRVPR